MKRLTDKQVQTEAAAMLRALICKHCHGRPSNVDRVRRAFNRKALAWVKNERSQKCDTH